MKPEVHAATPPAIVSSLPANGAQEVSINPSSIQFTFNEKVSMTNGYITVTNEKTGAQQRFAETSADGVGKIATADNVTFQLEGLQPFEAGTRYVVKVDGKLFLGEASKELSHLQNGHFPLNPSRKRHPSRHKAKELLCLRMHKLRLTVLSKRAKAASRSISSVTTVS